MGLVAPQPLNAAHQIDFFDCGNPALNDWQLNQARQAQGSGSARTFVVAEDERVVGYFSLNVGQMIAWWHRSESARVLDNTRSRS